MNAVPELGPADPRAVQVLLESLSELVSQVANRVDRMAYHGNTAIMNLAAGAQEDLNLVAELLAAFVVRHQAPEMLPLGEVARRALKGWE